MPLPPTSPLFPYTTLFRSKLSGPADRFGESAAILLGDLCLIWAEQMLRESGVEYRSLQQAWPRYDAMRTELAIGQFTDLARDRKSTRLNSSHANISYAVFC